MNVRPLAALLVWLAGSAAVAQGPAAPSDEPVPSEGPSGTVKKDGPLKLRGFDFELSIVNSSGVVGGPSYTNSLSLGLAPSFAIGRRFFEGRWLEPLAISANLPIEIELVGKDPRFSGSGFSTTALFNDPQQVAIAQAQVPPYGTVSGLVKHPVLVGDTWLGLSHGKLVHIPRAGLSLGANLRAVLPTSIASRNAGLTTAVSLGLSLDAEVGPLTIGYSARPTKYFFSRTAPPIIALSDTVLVNGKEEPVWRANSTGVSNPDWGVLHGPNLAIELPKNFGVSVSYLLSHVAPLRSRTCSVEGVPLANTCLDGPLVGAVDPNALREDQWFTFEVSWAPKLLTVAIGASTYRPLWQTTTQPRLGADGCATPTSCQVPTKRSVAQPFLVFDRNNYTTLYLSITATAEQLASVITEKKP